MDEGQFQLGTLLWGDGTELVIEDGEMPMPEIRDEDAENPLGHGGFAGRDRLGFSSWSTRTSTRGSRGGGPSFVLSHAAYAFQYASTSARSSGSM